MPGRAIPSVVKANAEVPPWALREVGRPTRNLENWLTQEAKLERETQRIKPGAGRTPKGA